MWLLCIAIIAWYARSWKRHRAEHPSLDRDGFQMRCFAGGIAILWIASDWPLGTLGGGYLASVHMLQYMLYTFGAAPLLILGTPEWMAESVLGRLRLRSLWCTLSKPLVAVAVSNVLLIVTHSPYGVDLFRSSQVGSFAMDMIWLLAGLILWAPVINPIPSARTESAPIRILYLFLAVAFVPMIPGAFITFSTTPLYSTYELAPRVGLTPLDDQQLAGVVMKIGSIPVIWTVMGVIWFRWYQKDSARPAHRAAPVRRADIDLTLGQGSNSQTPGQAPQ